MTSPAPLPPSRRERLHAATVTEIKDVARRLMAAEGTSSLNLRAVAREMGMTPSALYRYFASRDAILTALVRDAFDAVGEVVERAIDERLAAAPDDRTATPFLAAVHAFRRWAVEHPEEFALVYGTPVPGYEAPEEETFAASMRTNLALLRLLHRALEQGLVVLPLDDAEVPPPLVAGLCALGEKAGLPLGPAAGIVAMQVWSVLYGLLTTEVFHHAPPPLLEAGVDYFDFSMRRVLVAVGFDRAAVDASVSPPYPSPSVPAPTPLPPRRPAG